MAFVAESPLRQRRSASLRRNILQSPKLRRRSTDNRKSAALPPALGRTRRCVPGSKETLVKPLECIERSCFPASQRNSLHQARSGRTQVRRRAGADSTSIAHTRNGRPKEPLHRSVLLLLVLAASQAMADGGRVTRIPGPLHAGPPAQRSGDETGRVRLVLLQPQAPNPEDPTSQTVPPAPAAGQGEAAATTEPSESGEEESSLPVLPETEVVAEQFPREPLSGETVLSATATPTGRGALGSSVTVITEEDIRRNGYQTLTDALRGVPGLDLVQRGGQGKFTSVFLRGANSEHTKVLLDGIPLNDPSTPGRQFDFSNILLDDVERIEIVRGPQSTLYGSDAIGGVINITTRRGSGPPAAYTRVLGGSFDTYHQIAGVSGGTETVYYSFSGAYFDTNGFSAVSPRFGGVERDGFQSGSIAGRFGWTPNEAWDFDVVLRYIDSETEIDGFLADNLLVNQSEEFFLRTQGRYTMLGGRLRHLAAFNFANYNRDAPGGFQQFFDGETRQFQWRTDWTVWDTEASQNALSIAAEYWQEMARIDNFGGPIDAGQFSRTIWFEDRLALSDTLHVTAGFRHDDYNRAGTANTWRVTSRWWALADTALHGSIGTAFRAPAIAQLFGFGANPALRPERSRGWEVGVERHFFDGRLVADVTYFRNDFHDLIINGPPPTYTFMNIGRARASGIELTTDWRLTDATSLGFSYTHTDTLNAVDRTQLLLRPRHKIGAVLRHAIADGRGMLVARLRWVGRRFDFGPVELGSYTVVDASFTWDVTPWMRVFARVDNVFDERYEEAFGFSTAPLSAYGGAEIRLGGHRRQAVQTSGGYGSGSR
ncbi:MAG: TonB-dependent receptor [Planctomycetota bacterium]|nr:MAG: TonB-dependent receptor [Planctomycetota bacterium]